MIPNLSVYSDHHLNIAYIYDSSMQRKIAAPSHRTLRGDMRNATEGIPYVS